MFWPADEKNPVPYRMAAEVMDDFGVDIIFHKIGIDGLWLSMDGSVAERMLASGIVKSIKHAYFIRGFLQIWLMANLMDRFPPTICSPLGQKMKVDASLFHHGDRLDLIPLNFPIDEITELASIFRYVDSNGFSADALSERFLFINHRLGIIAPEENTENQFDYFDGNVADQAALSSIANNFRGWALFWGENELPSFLDLANTLFPSGSINWDWENFFGGDSVTGGGLSQVLADTLQAYPDGKNESWTNVSKKTGYSRRQINRALEKFGLMDWRNDTGQD